MFWVIVKLNEFALDIRSTDSAFLQIGSVLVDGCTDVDPDRFCSSQSDGFGSER